MLKGHTKIELKNEKTGEIQVVEKNNMVTNAVQRLFSDTFSTLTPYNTNSLNNILPICPNAIGSILLFEKQLDNDKDNIIIPMDNTCIGYASNDINTTQDTKRGSMNQTESGPIENGYKFVWDFATSQGNGQISSIGLSNKFAGLGYLDGSIQNIHQSYIACELGTNLLSNTYISIQNYSNQSDIAEIMYHICTFNINNSKAISIKYDGSSIIIRQLNIIGTTVHLTDSLTNFNITTLSTITPVSFLNVNTSNYKFFDGNNGYYYGFGLKSTYNYTIYWIKINKDDYSYTEGNYNFGSNTLYTPFFNWDNNCIVYNGYLYIMSYNRTSLYKINIDDMSQFNLIELGFTSSFDFRLPGYDYTRNRMFRYNKYIVCSDFIFNMDTQDVYKKTDTYNIPMTQPIYQNDLYMLYSYTTGTSNYSAIGTTLRFALFPYYLATKNNLDTPVTKTSEQSMKITYTLTEES